MKFAFLLATIVFSQNISSAAERSSADIDGIMPEQALRTGEFKASFTRTDSLGMESAERYLDTVPPVEPIEWEVYVPETHSAAQPAGILVYISPKQTGRIPNLWKPLL